jgi:hypothetical protein
VLRSNFNVDPRNTSLGGYEYQGEKLFSISSFFYSIDRFD